MNDMSVFAMELLATLAISIFVLVRLQDLLRRVGAEACGRVGSAEFWITYTQLMVLIGPLLLVAFFSRAGNYPGLSDVAQVKSSVFIVLSGHFISLVVVGRAVWKSIFTTPFAPAAAPDERGVPFEPASKHGGES